jgi:hypothetical protein
MPKAPSVKWTRENFLIALNLYCKLPFGQIDQDTPLLIDVASRMRRTPGSLAMKLSNFASLDPVQKGSDYSRQKNVFGFEQTIDRLFPTGRPGAELCPV